MREYDQYYQMTGRSYESYLSYLHLPEKFLENKTIIDVGSGMATFSEEANERLKSKNTRVYAIDINYDILPDADFLSLARDRFLDIIPGASVEPDAEEAWIHERKKSILRSAKKDSTFIAADRLSLPFKDKSADLIIYNNSVFPYLNHTEASSYHVPFIFEEGLRILRDNGEIRVKTTPFRRLDDDEATEMSSQERDEIHKLYQASKYGNEEDGNRYLVEMFKSLEKSGIRFYLVQYYEPCEHTADPWIIGSMVITKNDHDFSDEINISAPEENTVRVVQLDLNATTKNFFTPGKVVYMKEKNKEQQTS